MRDILLASGPIYFLVLVIVVIILVLGLIMKRASRKKFQDVNVNIYDPEKEAAQKKAKALQAKTADDAAEADDAGDGASGRAVDAADTGSEKE